MKKVVRLTESDLVRIVRRVIKEQEEELDEDWVDNLIMTTGPVGAGIASLFGRDEAWKNYVRAGKLFVFLSSNTGQQLLKSFISSSPVGFLKNASIAAARGDAKSLIQAFSEASKRGGRNYSQLQAAALADMKGFGNLLLKAGIK